MSDSLFVSIVQGCKHWPYLDRVGGETNPRRDLRRHGQLLVLVNFLSGWKPFHFNEEPAVVAPVDLRVLLHKRNRNSHLVCSTSFIKFSGKRKTFLKDAEKSNARKRDGLDGKTYRWPTVFVVRAEGIKPGKKGKGKKKRIMASIINIY